MSADIIGCIITCFQVKQAGRGKNMATDYEGILGTAISAAANLKPRNIYFVGCGGSLAYMIHQQYIIDRETEIPSRVLNSNEFIHRNPKALGKDSLVVLCSHSGTTPETVAAATFARQKGALTVAYTYAENSALWNAAEYPVLYDWGPESDAYNHKSGMALRFIFGFLQAMYPSSVYKTAIEVTKNLQSIYTTNKGKFAEKAVQWGSTYKRSPLIYTMGSGPVYGEAYSFAICLLQEMQWVNSAAIHSGEYFHGPFEITDYDVPFLLFKTVGETRPLDERAEAFARKFSKEVTTVDAADFDWQNIPEGLRTYFAAPVFGAVTRVYAEQLAENRGHPLSVRRYMWKMQY